MALVMYFGKTYFSAGKISQLFAGPCGWRYTALTITLTPNLNPFRPLVLCGEFPPFAGSEFGISMVQRIGRVSIVAALEPFGSAEDETLPSIETVFMELCTYALESFRENAEFILYRGRRAADPSHIFAVTPLSKHPTQGVLRRLEHEYSFRTKVDPAWAVVPLSLVREKGQTILVLEDPGGQPLDLLLERRLDLTEFLHISIGLANALGRLHERGIIHRDVKPANVIVDPTSNKVWLTGFGIASDLPRERQTAKPPETIAGTLAYMAPEQTGRMNR